MNALKPKHLKVLKRAIEEAACWRGSMIGNPDTSGLEEFDRFIATAEEAFEIVKGERNENRKQ